jgi:hypothetical protein
MGRTNVNCAGPGEKTARFKLKLRNSGKAESGAKRLGDPNRGSNQPSARFRVQSSPDYGLIHALICMDRCAIIIARTVA